MSATTFLSLTEFSSMSRQYWKFIKSALLQKKGDGRNSQEFNRALSHSVLELANVYLEIQAQKCCDCLHNSGIEL